MFKIHNKQEWSLPEREATTESIFFNRRVFLKKIGFAAAGSASLLYGLGAKAGSGEDVLKYLSGLKRLKVKRNQAFHPKRAITDEALAAIYNNFYEFSTKKDGVWPLVGKFKTSPWQVEVGGLVEKPRIFALEDLLREMPLEERVYRFRCVEAWSMVVPWTGFTFKSLLEKVRPLSSARFVKMTTFFRPKEAPRQAKGGFFASNEPWPYTEGLRLEEAMNDLTLLTVGSYGHILPKQHGAPIRLIVPWKYGFKSIKSIVKIELTAERPATFWNTIGPGEYGVLSNVNPKVPHPRWSQATERVLGGGGKRIPTLPFNGYTSQVAGLYLKG